jgi:hypothetical protein
MANSKLLKEAIADAKAVRETAIANAKIALEEAFTPRLQSILSRKLQAEMEGEEEEVVEDIDSSEIGTGDNEKPAAVAYTASTDLSGAEEETAEVGEEDENLDVVSEEEDMEMSDDEEMAMEGEEEMEFSDMEEEEEMMDDEELDLESIIRELEAGLEEEEDENKDGVMDDPTGAIYNEEEEMEEPAMEEEMESDEEEMTEEEDDVIDLEEILREMGYGEEEEVTEEEEVEMDAEKMAEMEAELEEAYKVIKSLRGTINEVNLLNAKLLYANKLFRSYNLNNEQKVKVVENLDRTNSVREVKLVYATLAESMKFGGAERKQTAKRVVSEGISSKPVASTAPKKEIIAESNELANRFKKLAGII